MDKSEEIKRVYKASYAHTSYQECPKCKNNIKRGDLNLIVERIIKYPVVNKIIK